MYKLKRILYIHIILIYFTFIYSQSHHSSRKQAHAAATTTSSTSGSTTSNTDELDLDELPEEKIKLIKEQYKELAKELVFDLKGQPSRTTTTSSQTNSKAFVPRAMLEEYIKMRDSVREIIPNDRDFYGKINIDDLDQTHEEFWSAVYNKYGSYDIQVDMGQTDEGLESRRFHYKGDASHIAHVGPESDPEDVAPNIEPILPPHSRSIQSQKQFISVHLRFNLSQEFYTRPTAAEDLRGAELHLARERIYDCEFRNCDTKPVPFFKNSDQNSAKSDARRSNHDRNNNNEEIQSINRLHNVPRYQRVYILHIFGYDRYDEPVTRIHASQRIDTRESTPLVFNIYPIVKSWLMNPKSNYGIIVRVTNDDKAYEQLVQLNNAAKAKKVRPPRSSKIDISNATANASMTEDEFPPIPPEVVISGHVRLKREFRATSESADTWLRKQPSILIFSKPTDAAKRHVKRHHSDNDEVQSDDPETITRDYSSTSSSSTSSTDNGYQQASDSGRTLYTSTDKSVGTHSITSTSGSTNRRDHVMAGNSRRGQQSSQRNSGNGARGQSQQQGGSNQRSRGKSKPSARQAEKCSKRALAINFDEVGWSSWIIAPQAYYANYCAGDCTWPLADTQNATNHAIIQAIYHSVGRVVPRSCCAPVKLGRMAILYQLDGIVQMRQYDDMIVEACGCL